MSCDDHVMSLLLPYISSNDTLSNHRFFHQLCGGGGSSNNSSHQHHTNASSSYKGDHSHSFLPTALQLSSRSNLGRDIYAFATPWIIVIGLVGNLISLRVFTSQQLRKLSASYYLIALSTSDTIVLSTYVLLDWLYKGLPRWPGKYKSPVINTQGVCQLYLFISYTFRFVSVYLTVVFTIERFIAVCKPLRRRQICTKRFARRLILSVHVVGALLSIYKPLLSGVFSIREIKSASVVDNIDNYFNKSVSADVLQMITNPLLGDEYICTRNIEYDNVILVMDFMYGMLITALPFLLIFIFNVMIMHKLIATSSITKHMNIQKNRMRVEMTVMLLTISTAFILLSLPYFIIWVQHYIQSLNPEDPRIALKFRSSMYVTKTIFCVNYSINFFLYCTTGKYYRGVLKNITCGRPTTSGQMDKGVSRTCTTPLRNQNTELCSLKSFA